MADAQEETGGRSEALERAHDTDLPLEERMKALEEDPPKDLSDWPKDREMRNATFGGGEGEHGYEEGPERNLGPSGVRHHEDGSVSVDGEKVDDPSEFKGDSPIEPAVQSLGDVKDEES